MPDDDDQATAATVGMMCDYIRAGIDDPVCKAWAEWALKCFGMGKQDPRAKFWAVFWALKHCVRYRRDEPELFRIGERSARDLLTAPAVLVRQPQPAEDCDGFTMLACTLLKILGLDSFIVTAKVDPQEPGRWSHVFAMADVPGLGLCALDGSHGNAPGWMVPRSHIFGYQVWDLSGNRIHKRLPVAAPRLNGYQFRARGMGDCVDDNGDSVPCAGGGYTPTESPYPVIFDGGPTGAPSSFNWDVLLGDIFGTAGKVASVAVAPPGSVVTPSGAVYTAGAVLPSQLSSSIGRFLPLLLIGGVVFLGISAIGGGKGRR